MNLIVSFSWVGPVIFALPMLINIAYVAFPPRGAVRPATTVSRPRFWPRFSVPHI